MNTLKEIQFYKTDDKKTYYFIDILKCVAVILIVNSHMEASYGKFASFASGGAIGLALFFFCSGFTLNISSDFAKYMKRRVARIYPTVFSIVFAESLLFGNRINICDVLLNGGGWFVSSIMIMYIGLFVIDKFFKVRIWGVFIFYLLFVITLLFYVTPDNPNYFFNGSANVFARVHYFIYMLLGYLLKNKIEDFPEFRISKTWLYFLSIVSPCSFYAILMFVNYDQQLLKYSIFACVLLIITIISWFLLTSTLNMALGKFTSRLYKGIKLISALSLEAYLCQTWVITDRLNHLFPFNLALIFIGILLVSYMLKIISNLFLQTFSERDYDFKRLIKIT